MSLLATASPWDSGESSAPSNKKRVSTMTLPQSRKTLKNNRESVTEQESFEELNPAHLGERIAGQPLSMEETKLKQNSNSLKINGLLNKITGFESESGAGRLADFKPPPNPTLTKTPTTHPTQKMTLENPLIPALPNSREPASPLKQFYQPFAKSHNNNHEFSNYVDAHSNRISYSQSLSSSNKDDLPYYAKKDDRINYIVHMLEEMQKEKTNHVTEEFVLYTMLGVFIIYIVDGFARIGTKYVR